MTPKLPTTQYIVQGYYSEYIGWAMLAEEATTEENAISAVMQWLSHTHNCEHFRVERIDRCHETNTIESVSDVTADIVEAIVDFYSETDVECPAMNGKTYWQSEPCHPRDDKDRADYEMGAPI